MPVKNKMKEIVVLIPDVLQFPRVLIDVGDVIVFGIELVKADLRIAAGRIIKHPFGYFAGQCLFGDGRQLRRRQHLPACRAFYEHIGLRNRFDFLLKCQDTPRDGNDKHHDARDKPQVQMQFSNQFFHRFAAGYLI